MRLDHARAALGGFPAELRRRLAGLSEAQFRFKPAAESFSLLENVCHLRDIEVEGYMRRLELLLTEADPLLPDLDGARLARERRYQEQALAPALEAFLAARRRNLTRLEQVNEADLTREGRFENVGVVSLARLLQMWTHHDAEHLHDVDELLAVLRDPARTPKPTLSLNPV
ncbi:MAG TPA: DinB family protein [Gammaproteobacteria bacterium]